MEFIEYPGVECPGAVALSARVELDSTLAI